MLGALDEFEKLFARADAAIAQARHLLEQNREWQRSTGTRVRQIYLRARFYPKSLKLYSPLDFPERRQPDQPFPARTDEPSSMMK
ncbi:hypothetical protein [Bradyrhizobium sp.]|uniref:hypothetical protein n=1 Tax=Bradyrhizobium sp. TaxID=376 RepID=UPI001DB0105B|nr:hypothetical protein [Bradyrhizobium sp.]MBV8700533.1 hypothetical protein [Bradyrhizobium sp.]MBV8921111.1 hypothetical protein [Bradyrhizobium sp.]MBV9981137.1 hypothetical protein [Bradyrhizobium sp.]